MFSVAMPLTTAAVPRRSTRSSLGRLSYSTESKSASRAGSPDIEDAIPDLTAGRKRKRGTAVATKQRSVKAEAEADADSDAAPAVATAGPSRARKARATPARVKTDPASGQVTVSPPSGWEEMYDLVKQMRLSGPAANAAVDTMGCERLAAPGASARDRRFHTLVALMLSSQTKDTVNAVAMARLQTELPPYRDGAPAGLNLENILAVEPAVLNEMIWQVGFHNNKTK